jgi:Skp family chaperone for outer membrane proteins
MRQTFAIAGIVALAASTVHAQDAHKSVSIGVINLDRVAAESQLGRSYATQAQSLQGEVDTLRGKKQAALDAMDEELKTLQEALDKQASLLSQDAVDQKQQELKKKARDRQAFIDDGTVEIQKLRERAEARVASLNAELQQKIKPHMESVAQEQGIDILLDSRSAVAIDAALDISPKVIAKLDATERPAEKTASAAPAAKK